MISRKTAITAAAAAGSMASGASSSLSRRACNCLSMPAPFSTSSHLLAPESDHRSASSSKQLARTPQRSSGARQRQLPRFPRGTDHVPTTPATAPFRRAMEGGHLPSVWTAWVHLRDTGKLQELSRYHVADMMRLAQAHMARLHEDSDLEQAKEMRAAWLTHARQTWDSSFLSECLRLELACGDAETAWESASEALQELATRHISRTDYFRPAPPDSPFQPISAELICLALAARRHLSRTALDDVVMISRRMRWIPPPSSVGGSHAKLSPISRGRAVRMLSAQGLSDSESDAHIDQLQLAWGLDDVGHSLELEAGKAREGRNVLARKFGLLLRDAGDVEAAMDVFRLSVDIAARGSSWLSMQPGDQGDFCDPTWATLISSLLASRHADLANEVWQAYSDRTLNADPQAPLAPPMRIWNALLSGHASAGDWEAVYATWRSLTTQGLQPDAFAYTSMISAMFRARRPDDAVAVFQQMKAKMEEQKGRSLKKGEVKLEISTETYNAVLHGLTYSGRGAQVERLLAEMAPKGGDAASTPTAAATAGLRPTIGTINTLIRGQARRGDVQGMVLSLQRIDELGLTPDVFTFTTVLDGLLRSGAAGGAPDAVDRVLGIMRSSGTRANEVTMTAIIKGLLNPSGTSRSTRRRGIDHGQDEGTKRAQEEGPIQLEAALRVLEQMESKGPSPTEVTYTSLIDAAFRRTSAALVTPLLNSSKAAKSLGQLLPSLRPDLGESSSTLAAAKRESPHRLLALALLDRMRAKSLEPNRKTYHSLLEGLLDFSGFKARVGPERGSSAEDLSGGTTRMMLRRATELFEEMCASTDLSEEDRRDFRPLVSGLRSGRSSSRRRAPGPKPQTWATMLRGLMQCLELRHLEGSPGSPLDEARDALREVMRRVETLGVAREDEPIRKAMERARKVLESERETMRR